MKKLITNYRLTVLFSSLIFSVMLLNTSLVKMTELLDQSTARMRVKTAKYKTSVIKDKITQLILLSNQTNPPYMEKNEARRFLALTAEDIKDLYGGSFSGSMTEEQSRLSIDLEFTVSPTNPNEIVQIINYMTNSITPVFIIRGISFDRSVSGKSVHFRVSVTQPFVGGTNEYK